MIYLVLEEMFIFNVRGSNSCDSIYIGRVNSIFEQILLLSISLTDWDISCKCSRINSSKFSVNGTKKY